MSTGSRNAKLDAVQKFVDACKGKQGPAFGGSSGDSAGVSGGGAAASSAAVSGGGAAANSAVVSGGGAAASSAGVFGGGVFVSNGIPPPDPNKNLSEILMLGDGRQEMATVANLRTFTGLHISGIKFPASPTLPKGLVSASTLAKDPNTVKYGVVDNSTYGVLSSLNEGVLKKIIECPASQRHRKRFVLCPPGVGVPGVGNNQQAAEWTVADWDALQAVVGAGAEENGGLDIDDLLRTTFDIGAAVNPRSSEYDECCKGLVKKIEAAFPDIARLLPPLADDLFVGTKGQSITFWFDDSFMLLGLLVARAYVVFSRRVVRRGGGRPVSGGPENKKKKEAAQKAGAKKPTVKKQTAKIKNPEDKKSSASKKFRPDVVTTAGSRFISKPVILDEPERMEKLFARVGLANIVALAGFGGKLSRCEKQAMMEGVKSLGVGEDEDFSYKPKIRFEHMTKELARIINSVRDWESDSEPEEEEEEDEDLGESK